MASLRDGRSHGTVLVGLERHQAVDLLPDWQAEAWAAWLRWRPGVEAIARNRAGASADGSREGASKAVQVAEWLAVGHAPLRNRRPAGRLGRDAAGVQAVLDPRWTTSPVEGQVNRLKLIKRARYGRAGVMLPRSRVPHAA